MRALFLVAGAALALSACGSNSQADDTQNVDGGLTADNIVSNDVTAIDAVTGDAANMAADVNYADFDNSVGGGSGSDQSSATPSRPTSGTSKPKPRQPDEPTTS